MIDFGKDRSDFRDGHFQSATVWFALIGGPRFQFRPRCQQNMVSKRMYRIIFIVGRNAAKPSGETPLLFRISGPKGDRIILTIERRQFTKQVQLDYRSDLVLCNSGTRIFPQSDAYHNLITKLTLSSKFLTFVLRFTWQVARLSFQEECPWKMARRTWPRAYRRRGTRVQRRGRTMCGA